MKVRPYDPDRDEAALWNLKSAFESDMGAAGDPEKQAVYASKLTDAYREGWLDWVARCVSENQRCVQVAATPGREAGGESGGRGLIGYVFVLPQSLAFVWDAAVLNEIYVAPNHRGEGVGDELLETAVAVARQQDLPLDRLVLDVDRENDRAQAFYRRHGFQHWGEMLARDL